MKVNKKCMGALVSIVLLLVLILLINIKSVGRSPELETLSVTAAYPGETITLYGNYFGGEISRGRVFMNDKMVFSRFIKSWDNKEIKLTLADDFKSGMITVVNMFGESNSSLITSLNDVPKIKLEGSRAGYPFIESVNYLDDSDLNIAILGRGFGSKKDSSSLSVKSLIGEFIDININSIISWEDDLITFNIPYGIDNIILSVNNNIGHSNEWTLHNNDAPAIIYSLKNSILYNLKQTVEIKNVVALKNSYINLFIPCVYGDFNQKNIEFNSIFGTYNLRKNIYEHSLNINDSGYEDIIELDTIVEVSSVEVKIRKDLIGRVYNKESPDYIMGFNYTPNVNETDKDMYNTSTWLVRNISNRLSQVEAISNWVLRYITVNNESEINSALGFKNRSVADFGLVNLTTAMLRSIGIPSRVVRGIKITDDATPYQWIEFYLPNGGWVPFDIIEMSNNNKYKIGFLENNRIGFSKGVTIIDYQDNVYKSDFYALQNSISNSQGNIESYEAVWHNVQVK